MGAFFYGLGRVWYACHAVQLHRFVTVEGLCESMVQSDMTVSKYSTADERSASQHENSSFPIQKMGSPSDVRKENKLSTGTNGSSRPCLYA